MIFEPLLRQEPPGSIGINLSWTWDEGTSPAHLTAFPFLILSHAIVASSSSAPRSGANPSPCFSSRKINLTFQVMLSWPALCWWEKASPQGLPGLQWPFGGAEPTHRSLAYGLFTKAPISAECGMLNRKICCFSTLFYNLCSLSSPCGFIKLVAVHFHSFFWSTTPCVSGLAMTMAHKTLAAPVREWGIVW